MTAMQRDRLNGIIVGAIVGAVVSAAAYTVVVREEVAALKVTTADVLKRVERIEGFLIVPNGRND